MKEIPKFLDARTKDKRKRLNSFSDHLEDIMRDYQTWLDEEGLKKEDIWYADIFSVVSLKHLYKLEIYKDEIYATVAPEDSDVNPFKRHRNLKQMLSVLTRNIADKLEKTAW